jgi:hypothetical protein
MFKFLFIYFLLYELIVLFKCKKYYNWFRKVLKKKGSEMTGTEAFGSFFIMVFVAIPYLIFIIYLAAFSGGLKFYFGTSILILSIIHNVMRKIIKHYSIRLIDCILTITIFVLYILESRNIINLIN